MDYDCEKISISSPEIKQSISLGPIMAVKTILANLLYLSLLLPNRQNLNARNNDVLLNNFLILLVIQIFFFIISFYYQNIFNL